MTEATSPAEVMELCGEPLSAECWMCGEMVFNHPAVVECFETFGEMYCEFCAVEALEEEAAA